MGDDSMKHERAEKSVSTSFFGKQGFAKSSMASGHKAGGEAQAFTGTQKCGKLRVSGKSGAHMVGCKK